MDAELRTRIEKAAEVLVGLGAREVYVFGSAATGRVRAGSDVDLAVRGLPPALFFRAIADAADVLGCDVDLIDLDDDSPFTRYLQEEGELQRVA